MERCCADIAGTGEDVLWDDGGESAIGELGVGNLRGQHHVPHHLDVVDVPDTAAVDATNVARVGRVARPIGLAWREWEPADLRPDRPGHIQPDARSAEKRNERRRVNRRRLEGPRNPAPAIFDHCPASVMARRKSPGLNIDPGPAPWRDPNPPAIGVRRPPRRNVRVPDPAVTGSSVPTAALIKLDIARHVWRDMVGCGEALLVIVARSAPFDKSIGNCRLECRRDGADTVQHRDIAGLESNVRTAADKSRAALEHRDACRLILGPGIDVVIAGLEQMDSAAREVDLKALALIETAQVEDDAPLRNAEPSDTLVELGDIEFRAARHIDRVRRDPDLRAGIGVCPQ